MIVVADSSPFVVLIAIDHLELLPILFQKIIIPPQVETELASSKRTEQVRSFLSIPPAWLRVIAPASIELIPDLHVGEIATMIEMSLARIFTSQ